MLDNKTIEYISKYYFNNIDEFFENILRDNFSDEDEYDKAKSILSLKTSQYFNSGSCLMSYYIEHAKNIDIEKWLSLYKKMIIYKYDNKPWKNIFCDILKGLLILEDETDGIYDVVSMSSIIIKDDNDFDDLFNTIDETWINGLPSKKLITRSNCGKTFPIILYLMICTSRGHQKAKYRILILLKDIFHYLSENNYILSKHILNDTFFNIYESKLFLLSTKKIKDIFHLHYIVDRITIGLYWEKLCYKMLREIYGDEHIIYQKILPNGARADIVLVDETGKIIKIYECKMTMYFLEWDNRVTSLKGFTQYTDYTDNVICLVLDNHSIKTTIKNTKVINAKQLIRKKIPSLYKQEIKNLLANIKSAGSYSGCLYYENKSQPINSDFDKLFHCLIKWPPKRVKDCYWE